MKIFKNVLSPVTLNIVHRELMNNILSNEAEDNKVWTCSNFKWGKDVLVNISGTTMVSIVSQNLSQLILDDIRDLLPKEINHTRMQFFVWTPNAGISCHTDGKYKFGATIYLNEQWNIDDGGIFLYQHEGDDWRAHIPEFNTMALNDNTCLHLVTPVSPFAKQNRYTIQIFGDNVNG